MKDDITSYKRTSNNSGERRPRPCADSSESEVLVGQVVWVGRTLGAHSSGGRIVRWSASGSAETPPRTSDLLEKRPANNSRTDLLTVGIDNRRQILRTSVFEISTWRGTASTAPVFGFVHRA